MTSGDGLDVVDQQADAQMMPPQIGNDREFEDGRNKQRSRSKF